MDSSAVDRLRAALAGTGWVDRAVSLARSLRTAGHDPGGFLLVGTPEDEPWHLAAHLDEEARYAALPQLRPTLVRWAPPPGAPPHLAVGLERLTEVARGETVFVVASDAPPERLLEQVADARRGGATVLAMDGSVGEDGAGTELTGLAHDSLVVPRLVDAPSLDVMGHLLSAAAGQAPRRRFAWRR